MKRFYCTICKKVKRVRKMPRNVVNSDSTYAEERRGECARHSLKSGNMLKVRAR